MEPITVFAAAVAFIGIFHLLSTAINLLAKGRNMSVVNSGKKRSDWYCFFKMSDLLGQDALPDKKREIEQSGMRDKDLAEQKRQQEARRPRLYV